MATTNEYVLSLNNFDEPKVYKDNDAIAIILVRIVLMDPGTIQSHPEMGVGLVSRYRYYDQDKLNDLEKEISDQISTYLPTFRFVDVKVKGVNRLIIIYITIDKTIYGIEVNLDNGTFKLSDLKNN